MHRIKIVIAILALGSIGLVAYLIVRGVAEVGQLKHRYPVIHYNGAKEQPLVTLEKKRPASWVTIDQVSRSVVGAVLVSEDWAFYQHKGFDPKQIEESIKVNLKKKGLVRGASTITQQVARNVFLSHKKSLWRKFRELVLAMLLEREMTKRQILEVYMNVAEWGEGTYGISAASHLYFNEPPARLGAKEGAFLAMLLPSPKRYGVSFRQRMLTPHAGRTIHAILDKMVQAGYLSPAELENEELKPLAFEKPIGEEEMRLVDPKELQEEALPEIADDWY
ncbi:MAG TPA: biosynthetic peptidoglycan transglycosylase [Bdellovibrionota bacterium]|nr:biosynthetic peptidoglycan transglycosylase [Bdellovibrionota bacterium]